MVENFRYAEAVAALQPRPKVQRLRNFTGLLPGIRASETPKG